MQNCPPARLLIAPAAFLLLLQIASAQISGVLDPAFANGGILVASQQDGEVWDVATMPSGHILATGSGSTDGAVLRRFTSDGTLDPGFGDSGTVSFPNNMFPRKIAVQSDGRIVLAGNSSQAIHPAFVARLLPDGSFDGSFGNGGMVDVTLYTHTNFYEDLKVLADGSILAVGSGRNLPAQEIRQGTLIRLHPDGSWFTSFGENGLMEIELAEGATFIKTAEQDLEGRLLVSGDLHGGPEYTVFLALLRPGGYCDRRCGPCPFHGRPPDGPG